MHVKKQERIGSVMQKVLLLLMGGAILGLSGNPHSYFRIVRGIKDEWKRIDSRTRDQAIKKLHSQGFLEYVENKNGWDISLSQTGEKAARILSWKTKKNPVHQKWDGLWRIVMFDIPEHNKTKRNIIRDCLFGAGFYRLQKSVFLFPYECEKEVSELVQFLDIKEYVQILLVKNIGDASEYLRFFKLT